MPPTPKPPSAPRAPRPERPVADAKASDGRLEIVRVRQNDADLPYYYALPDHADAGARPLVAVHGISRNASEHVAAFAPFTARTGQIVLAPLFRTADWPYYQRVRTTGRRADDALMAALDDLSARTGVSVDRVDLFGFSGGSQFAHRFAMLHPGRVGGLVLASAGWYTFPSEEDPFPYGIAPSGAEAQRIVGLLHEFLRIPTLVTVGAEDTERDAGLRKERIVDLRQGLTRVERGSRWVSAMRDRAVRQGVPATIEFRTVAGCGHSFDDCVARGGLAGQVVDWFEKAH